MHMHIACACVFMDILRAVYLHEFVYVGDGYFMSVCGERVSSLTIDRSKNAPEAKGITIS